MAATLTALAVLAVLAVLVYITVQGRHPVRGYGVKRAKICKTCGQEKGKCRHDRREAETARGMGQKPVKKRKKK